MIERGEEMVDRLQVEAEDKICDNGGNLQIHGVLKLALYKLRVGLDFWSVVRKMRICMIHVRQEGEVVATHPHAKEEGTHAERNTLADNVRRASEEEENGTQL